MALTKDQQFSSVIFFLLNNGEDFRIVFDGEEWMNIGKTVYCNGEEAEWANLENEYA